MGIGADGGHAAADGDAGQTDAVIESATADTGHAVRDGDASQTEATKESMQNSIQSGSFRNWPCRPSNEQDRKVSSNCTITHAAPDIHSGQA